MTGYGKAWGKQVAVRFEPDDLALLDALVVHAAQSRSDFFRETKGWYLKATRSSVVLELVRRAAKALPKAKAAPAAKGGRR